MKNNIKNAIAESYYNSMIEIIESLDAFHGKGEGRKIILKPHLQIRHKDSGINYTIKSVDMRDYRDPIVSCYRYTDDGNRKYIVMGKDDFSKYERA